MDQAGLVCPVPTRVFGRVKFLKDEDENVSVNFPDVDMTEINDLRNSTSLKLESLLAARSPTLLSPSLEKRNCA